MTETDHMGRFSLDSLSEQLDYTVIAGAEGYGMQSGEPGLLPGVDTDVSLEVSPLFGLVLHLVGPDGLSLFPAGFLPPSKLPVDVQVEGAQYLTQPNYTLELAGLEDPAPYLAADVAQYLFLASEDHEAVGPLTLRAEYPGWRPVVAELWALPVAEGLETVVLELSPWSAARGSLTVIYKGIDNGTARKSFRSEGVGRIVLISDEGKRLEYRVSDLSAKRTLLQGLPYGEYRIRFLGNAPSVVYPPTDSPHEYVSIGEQPAEWNADLGAYGNIELVIVRDMGAQYGGPLSFYLLDGKVSGSGQRARGVPVVFDRPPYCIQAVSPGFKTLIWTYPKLRPNETGLYAIVEAVAGEDRKFTLVLEVE
jgi:hypothetical protein